MAYWLLFSSCIVSFWLLPTFISISRKKTYIFIIKILNRYKSHNFQVPSNKTSTTLDRFAKEKINLVSRVCSTTSQLYISIRAHSYIQLSRSFKLGARAATRYCSFLVSTRSRAGVKQSPQRSSRMYSRHGGIIEHEDYRSSSSLSLSANSARSRGIRWTRGEYKEKAANSK